MKKGPGIHRRGGSRGAVVALLVLLGILAGLGAWAWIAFTRTTREPSTNVAVGPALQPVQPTQVRIPNVTFTDITERAGIRFRHTSGATGQKLLPETMGSGVVFFDYDNDGKPDLLFINSCPWPGQESRSVPAPTMAVYHNTGGGKFEDVTHSLGLAITMYGMGAAAGDYDNDGLIDVFLTGVGGNRLYRNTRSADGIHRFVDVTAAAKVGGPGGWPGPGKADFFKIAAPLCFSTSAAFLDYDGDGLLDLFTCNYVTWSPDYDLSQGFQLVGKGRAFGPPTAFEGTQCILYRNAGGGTFEDVSQKAGIHVLGALRRPVAKSLGIIVCDVDEDGWPDVIIANDTVRNFFFHNKGDGTFEELGEIAGVGLAEGRARGAMGIDYGEYRPGRHAVLIGNFADEPNTFLRLDNRKSLLFSDAATAEGIAGPSRTLLKFGAFFFDYDLDGRQDLLTCNGHLEPDINKVSASQQYKQPAQLFWNCGPQRKIGFIPVTEREAGSDLFQPIVGRGSAYADIDGDGDLDVVLSENNGPGRLFRNECNKKSWIRFVLEGDGKRSNRSAIGATVILDAGGASMRREVLGARGYLSQSELAVTFGLGDVEKVDKVTINWPGKQGGQQVLTNPAVNQTHVIRQQ